MANGNCRSMKSDIEGKMTSEVNGLDDTTAATANELKATSTRRALLIYFNLSHELTYEEYRSIGPYLETEERR